MRARNLKPALYKNDELAECSIPARYLFTGLWCLADRCGRLKDRPKVIKAEIFPWDDIDVDALLQELHDHGFIQRYDSAGERYVEVTNFRKHQRPHKNEKDSDIPGPDPEPLGKCPEPDEPRPEALEKRSQALRPEYMNDESRSDESRSPDPVAASESPPGEEEVPKPIDLVQVWCDEMETDLHVVSPQFTSQQCAVAKEILERGYGPDVVRKRVRYLKAQGWRDEPPDLRHALKGIDSWYATGAVEQPPSRASPRKRRSDDPPFDPERNLTGAYAEVFKRERRGA